MEVMMKPAVIFEGSLLLREREVGREVDPMMLNHSPGMIPQIAVARDLKGAYKTVH